MTNKEEKVISIHQPNYIPWLGYFYKIFKSDVFVFLDDAQYSNDAQQNFHYIKTPQGSFRLKIPVKKNFGDKIHEVNTRDELGWKNKHLKTLETNYRKAKFFDEVYSDFEKLISVEIDNLAILNSQIIKFICSKFGIETEFISSSSLKLDSVREEKIIDICTTVGGTVYYSGTGAQAYQNEENFTERVIKLVYSDFKPFEYPQLWGDFQVNVSIVDFLMNCGYDWDFVMEKQRKLQNQV